MDFRVWERGSGETMACGTGACAALVAAVLTGRTSGTPPSISAAGDLDVEWGADDPRPDDRRTAGGSSPPTSTSTNSLPPAAREHQPNGHPIMTTRSTRFGGSMVALATPFKDGAIDWSAFAAMIERQITHGSSALVPCGSSGEAATLTHEEHTEVVRFVGRAGTRPRPGHRRHRLQRDRRSDPTDP